MGDKYTQCTLFHKKLYYAFSSHAAIGKDIEQIVDVLLEVENWESLAGRLGINHKIITTNCGVSSDYASCSRRRLVEIFCDAQEAPFSMNMIADEIAQVLNDEMSKKRQAGNMRRLSFSGE